MGGDPEWEPWARESLAQVQRLAKGYLPAIGALGRTIQAVRLGRGPYGPEIHILYQDAADGNVYDWDMPTLAGGSPDENPDSIASTIVINFMEPTIR